MPGSDSFLTLPSEYTNLKGREEGREGKGRERKGRGGEERDRKSKEGEGREGSPYWVPFLIWFFTG